MKCKDCKNLKNRSTYGQCYAHEGCKICKDSDDGCFLFESAIQTNGDRIRAMSNEELAEYQIHRADDCPDLIKDDAPCMIKKNYETQTDCKKCWLDWLNSPAESEVNHESEPKFTPGTWNVAGFDSRINEERYFGIDTPRGQMIVESFGECDFNRKANAALISAAPEMYAKLKELADVLRFGGMRCTNRTMAQEIEEILKKARVKYD